MPFDPKANSDSKAAGEGTRPYTSLIFSDDSLGR